MRLFAAIPVPVDVAAVLADHAEVLASRSAGVVALAAEELVLPVAFFGDVSEECVPAVAKAVEAAASRVHGAISCDLSGSVLLRQGTERGVRVDLDLFVLLGSMRDELLSTVAPYAPHRDLSAWTPRIALVRSADGDVLPEALRDLQVQPLPASWIARELTLMTSIMGPVGRHYRPLYSAPLGPMHAPTRQ